MSKLFISHSSRNDAEAVAMRDWLREQGWDDVFLDLDAERGIGAGQRWRDALNQAANRCEAVLFLISEAWLASPECRRELALADKLNKVLIGAVVEEVPLAALPATLTGTWQVVDLAGGRDHEMRRVLLPAAEDRQAVTFSRDGLARLKAGLTRAGLDPSFFAWPPAHDPDRAPYPGLRPLEAEDAGIFFGREAQTVEALDRLRALREGAAPRFLCILGASGSGKSSFLRAGLWPRLARDDRTFLPLPVLRPERAALTGKSGLLAVLEGAFKERRIPVSRADLRGAIEDGAETLRPVLWRLADDAFSAVVGRSEPDGVPVAQMPPLLVLPIDQGEELFVDEAGEGAALLGLLRDLLGADQPAIAVLMTIRSDAFERLQLAAALEGIGPQTLTFGPMPRGVYGTVIEAPAARLRGADRKLDIDPALTRALLADMGEGGARDALPLLAFTLERLWMEFGGGGRLALADYEALGRVRGSIEAAVEAALRKADGDPRIPAAREVRLALLRRGLVPWLAGIDPDTGSPRRRVARRAEIPDEARPLIDLLVEARLLAADIDPVTGEATVEPAHEALLRQWGLLQGWLEEDFGALATLEGVRRAARDWDANGRNAAWLAHRGDRLVEAEHLPDRPDLAAQFGPAERAYLAECRSRADREAADSRGRARLRRLLQWGSLAAALVFAALGALAWTERRDALDQRQDALAQRQAAVASEAAAQRERDRARAALANAKSAADGLIFDVAQRLRGRGLPVRVVVEVLGRAETLMTRLVEATPDDPGLLRSQAAMYTEFAATYAASGSTVRQSEVAERSLSLTRRLAAADPADAAAAHDLVMSLNLVGDARLARGDFAGALDSHEEALGSARRGSLARPADDGATRDVAVTLTKIGDVRVNLGDLPGALPPLTESLVIARRLAAASPASRIARRDVQIALGKIGNVRLLRGDLAGAWASFAESLGLARALLAEDPSDTTSRRDLSVELERRARVQVERGEFASAVVSSEESLAMRRELAALDPSDAGAARDLSVMLNNIGEIELAQGRVDAASGHIEESFAIALRLAAADPSNARGARDLSIAHEKRGDVAANRAERATAIAHYGDSLAIRRRLAAADPANAVALRDVSVALEKLGIVAEEAGEYDAAEVNFTESLALRRRLAAADASHGRAARDVALALAWLGDVGRARENFADALALYREALAITRRLVATDGSDFRAAQDLFANLIAIGDVQDAQGDVSGALGSYEEALASTRQVAEADPSEIRRSRNVAVALTRGGEALVSLVRMDEAAGRFAEALAISRRLLAETPASRDAGRNVSVLLVKVGEVAYARGDHAGAFAAFAESLDLARPLAAAYPSDGQLARDVSIPLDRIGDALAGRGQFGEARARYAESLAIRRRLLSGSPSDPVAARDVTISLERIGGAEAAQGHFAAAWLSYAEALTERRRAAAARPGPGRANDLRVLVGRVGSLSYRAILGREYRLALTCADAAIEAEPGELWLRTNRAHALMMLDEIEAARAEYLGYRGRATQNGKPWEAAITDDFAALRQAGITHPLMGEIEAAFAQPR